MHCNTLQHTAIHCNALKDNSGRGREEEVNENSERGRDRERESQT